MSQYTAGTVTVTNGSNVVTGAGTAWLASVDQGDIFTVLADGVWYEVAGVASDTSLTLAANYGGVSGGGKAYAVTQSFTQNAGIPYPEQGDVETASLFRRAMATVEQLITGRLSLSVAGSVSVTLTAAQARNPILEFTGALTANIDVIVPAKTRQYVVRNATTGAYTLTLKTPAGAGLAIGQGKRVMAICDGTDVVGLHYTVS